MSNTLGTLLRLTTFGESHGEMIGGILDGFPAGFTLDFEALQHEMNRRKPGQSKLTTQRKEADEVNIVSGVFEGKTTGTPIGFFIRNTNSKSADYDHLATAYRPSHADYTYDAKYGHRDYRGGGRASARETANWVAAGALCKQYLQAQGISIQAYTKQIGTISTSKFYQELNLASAEENLVRCPDAETAEAMETAILTARKAGDTLGGIVTCVVKHVPAGLGEPVFNKLHAALAHAMLSINAVKGFEYGSGFEGVKHPGSTQNDLFLLDENNHVAFSQNNSGGIQGGISNGNDIYFNVAFKPVATLLQDQQTLSADLEEITLKGKGRHDPCVVPRAVPIVEALTALVLLDFWLLSKKQF